MALTDVTVDTNVMMHACNPNEKRCASAIEFLQGLLAANTLLAVDEGFHVESSLNKSHIAAEYLEKFVPGSLAAAVVRSLAINNRILNVSIAIPYQKKSNLIQMVKNKRDRTFIQVCASSPGKSLVSHDFLDFPKKKRKDLGVVFQIQIVESSVATPLLI